MWFIIVSPINYNKTCNWSFKTKYFPDQTVKYRNTSLQNSDGIIFWFVLKKSSGWILFLLLNIGSPRSKSKSTGILGKMMWYTCCDLSPKRSLCQRFARWKMFFGGNDGWQTFQLVIVRDKNEAKWFEIATATTTSTTCLLQNIVPSWKLLRPLQPMPLQLWPLPPRFRLLNLVLRCNCWRGLCWAAIALRQQRGKINRIRKRWVG